MGNIINSLVNVEGSERSNGYDWSTTAQDVVAKEGVSLKGKNVLLTGATGGIGKETARALASCGAQVFLACLNKEEGERAATEIRKQLLKNSGEITVMTIDLASFQSVREFSVEFHAKSIPLHVLICNAAICQSKYTETVDGIELNFQVNYLSNFLLVHLLRDCLERGRSSRVILLSSTAHRGLDGKINFEDLSGKGTWFNTPDGSVIAYGQSKVAMPLFAQELDRRMKADRIGINAFALHPGTSRTNLFSQSGICGKAFMFVAYYLSFMKTTAQGAATTVYLALTPRINGLGGKYFSDCNIAQPCPMVHDPTQALKLWNLSEGLVGIRKRKREREKEREGNVSC